VDSPKRDYGRPAGCINAATFSIIFWPFRKTSLKVRNSVQLSMILAGFSRFFEEICFSSATPASQSKHRYIRDKTMKPPVKKHESILPPALLPFFQDKAPKNPKEKGGKG
jgi:hypothetical protein